MQLKYSCKYNHISLLDHRHFPPLAEIATLHSDEVNSMMKVEDNSVISSIIRITEIGEYYCVGNGLKRPNRE